MKTKTVKQKIKEAPTHMLSENTTHILGSIYDTKAGIFLALNLFRTTADFIRAIQVEAKNPQSMLHKFPKDYELFLVGEWHESDGISTTLQKRLGSVFDLCPLV